MSVHNCVGLCQVPVELTVEPVGVGLLLREPFDLVQEACVEVYEFLHWIIIHSKTTRPIISQTAGLLKLLAVCYFLLEPAKSAGPE